MIPREYITEWRTEAPWEQDFQIQREYLVQTANGSFTSLLNVGMRKLEYRELSESVGSAARRKPEMRDAAGGRDGTCQPFPNTFTRISM
jgi:hypothetical protein